MKITSTFFLVVLFLFLTADAIPQDNSVELRDAANGLVGTYPTIQAAYNAIPATLTQSYTIEILPAYTNALEVFPISLTSRIDAGPLKTVTIRPKAGNTGESIVGNASGVAIINFDDADYVILDGRPGGVGTNYDLVVENLATSGSNSFTINFINGAVNNTVMCIHSINHTQSTAGPRNIMFNTSATNITGNSNNTIASCKITGGRTGVASSGTTANPNVDNKVMDCEVVDFGYAGFWLLAGTVNFTIRQCSIYQTAGISSTLVFGIQTGSTTLGKIDISENKIYDLRTSSGSATNIRAISLVPARGCVQNIINNFISLMLNGTSISGYYGIQIAGTVPNECNILYNTIRIGGTHSAGGTSGAIVTAPIYKSGTNDTAVVNAYNNICVNERTGGSVLHAGMNIANANGHYAFDYNDYWATGAGNPIVSLAGVGFTDLATYKTAATPNEVHSNFMPVEFVSENDLHLTGASVANIGLLGIPITGISQDIDGQTRDPLYPYMGADEANIPVPVELLAFSYALEKNDVILSWSTATETNNKGFEVQRKSEGEWRTLSFIEGNKSTAAQSNYSYRDANLKSGTYSYRLKQVDYDGSFSYLELSSDVTVGLPDEFALSQNYPNPFNPSTTIEYSIKRGGEVTLRVYDVLGNEVATLVNEVQEPGYYTINFNAASLSSGVYIYTLESGEYNAMKKLLLLK